MTGPSIPYIDAPVLPLHFLDGLISDASIKPFGTLVAIGVYIGSIVAVRHARQRGQDLEKMNSFIFWVVGLGFVGGHVFDAIFYTPEKLHSDSLYIFKLWAGLSSFGGFLGAIIGAVAFKLTKKQDVLPLVDTVCSAFPLAWVFGRSGCSSVHDHPGMVSTAWYAVKAAGPEVKAPAVGWMSGSGTLALQPGQGRLDLGLIEMVLTIPLALAFWWLWKSKPRQYGFFAGWMCVAYAPVRFVLDFLRIEAGKGGEGDPRYGGLTPAQWACFGLIGLGFYIIHLGKKSYAPVPGTYAEMEEAARLREEGPDEDDEDDDGEDRRERVASKTGVSRSQAPNATKTGPKVTGSVKKKKKKKAAAPPPEENAEEKEASDDARPSDEAKPSDTDESESESAAPKKKSATKEKQPAAEKEDENE